MEEIVFSKESLGVIYMLYSVLCWLGVGVASAAVLFFRRKMSESFRGKLVYVTLSLIVLEVYKFIIFDFALEIFSKLASLSIYAYAFIFKRNFWYVLSLCLAFALMLCPYVALIFTLHTRSTEQTLRATDDKQQGLILYDALQDGLIKKPSYNLRA